MRIKQEKRYLCAVCHTRKIVEERIEETLEGSVPDQCNCDLSKYTDYMVIGGALFKNRSQIDWQSVDKTTGEKEQVIKLIPVGGICDHCLGTNFVVERLKPYLCFDEN